MLVIHDVIKLDFGHFMDRSKITFSNTSYNEYVSIFIQQKFSSEDITKTIKCAREALDIDTEE